MCVENRPEQLCLSAWWRLDHWFYRAGEMAAHRFLDSPYVTPQEILNTAAGRTAAACCGRRIVAAQDTTEINFSGRSRGRKGLGQQATGRRRDSSAMRWWRL